MLDLTKAQRRLVRDNDVAAKLVANTSVAAGGCWAWRGRPDTYGVVAIAGKTRKVHRVAYEVFVGSIPDGQFVCHHCDMPGCINPVHLFLGDAAANMRDMVRKGRAAKMITSRQDHFKDGRAPNGERASGAKLTETQATEIVHRHRSGEKTKRLAAEYGGLRDKPSPDPTTRGRET